MKHFSKFLLLISFFVLVQSLFAQEVKELKEMKPLKDSLYLKKKDYQKQMDYENNTYAFPAKKKNMWSLGLHAGMPYLIGDIDEKYGFGGGINIQKALGHTFALRFQGIYAQVYGQEVFKTTTGIYRNYKLEWMDFSLQGMVYLNNINYYKRNPKVLIYALAGGGVSTRKVSTNELDANGNAYDYSSIASTDNFLDRFRVQKDIKSLQDKTYETVVNNKPGSIRSEGRQVNPSIVVGAGLAFKLSRRVDLNLEQRFSYHGDDVMDGTRFTREGYYSGSQDIMSYTNICFNFKIGKREEPLYWVNPLTKPYEDLMAMKVGINNPEFIKDDDEDGVMDIYDKELNTPKNAMVNTHGVTLDIDGDGITDRIDDEPFSPKRAKVNKNGVALDSDQDGVADVFDRENGSPSGVLVDAKGFEIKASNNSNMPSMFKPIFFDLNKDDIKKEFYPNIYEVAAYMQENPASKMKIYGNTDNRAADDYNLKLSQRRAENVVNLLVTAFGIAKDRFEILANGKNSPIVNGLPAKYDPNTEGSHYLNRRVSFEVK
jgi:outer membrane protein OmpA-like peptidoglycan-associated protein/opacity protein-like surface antigen